VAVSAAWRQEGGHRLEGGGHQGGAEEQGELEDEQQEEEEQGTGAGARGGRLGEGAGAGAGRVLSDWRHPAPRLVSANHPGMSCYHPPGEGRVYPGLPSSLAIPGIRLGRLLAVGKLRGLDER